ncbi:MAG: DUF1513 domain-containing protein [Deltaproteobacteria bacterium]|nr:DUF1513 domain-containing protein [Deltaproteobacteria bacterium]MBW2421364.1 DUF1513 domain-containing protein [Deltaproteobacteria bacterium]
MPVQRREFIRNSALLTAGLVVPAWVVTRSRTQSSEPPTESSEPHTRSPEWILGGGRYALPEAPGKWRHVLSLVDSVGSARHTLELPFLPHAAVLDPTNPDRIVTFEKIGAGAADVDVSTMKLSRLIEPAPGRWFYGHGAFSPDGALLYSTETERATQQGVLAVRDAKTLERLGEVPTHGASPHDCHLIESGRVMVSTNGGGTKKSPHRPSVTWVELSSGKLLDRLELDTPLLNSGHVGLAADRGVVVVSAPRAGLPTTDPGGVSIGRRGVSLLTMVDPKEIATRMQGEALSVAIHPPTGIAAVTHPDANRLTFWSLHTQRFAGALELVKPRGVALNADGSAFWVSQGASADLIAVSPETREVIPGRERKNTLITGSHILNLTRARAAADRPKADQS